MVAFEGFYGSPASRATEVEHAKQPATPTTRLIPPSGLSLGFVPLAHSLLPPPLRQLLSAQGQPMAMLAVRAHAWALAQIRVRMCLWTRGDRALIVLNVVNYIALQE
jgi:hypothetical protein